MPAAKHLSLDCGCPHCLRGRSAGLPQGVCTLAWRKKGKLHVPQTAQTACLANEVFLPKTTNGLLHSNFKQGFSFWCDKDMKGVWEGVLNTEGAHLGEPGVWYTMVENIDSMLMQDI